MAEYDRNKDKILFKKSFNVGRDKNNRYLNVVAYSYNNGEPKIRIEVSNKNTNPNADSKKQWIRVAGISSITREEASKLIVALKEAIYKL